MRDVRERFLEKVNRDGPIHPRLGTRCWLWTAAQCGHGMKRGRGYGNFLFRRRLDKAHRVSWVLFVGEIPAGQCVLHKCDVTTCVRPDHLFLGTVLENNADMDRKGRRRSKPVLERCARGHEFTPENTVVHYPRRRKARYCRQCHNETGRALYLRTKVPAPVMTHCKRGHEFTPENTRTERKANGRSSRRCKTCYRSHYLEQYRTQKALRLA